MKIISLENVTFRYDDQPVLRDVDLDIDEGEFLAVVGPNGGGKTTLLKIILGFLKPVSGVVLYEGRKRKRPAHRFLSYVPQNIAYDPLFPISTLDVVLMGAVGRTLLRYSHDDETKAMELLEKFSLEKLSSERFGNLSGGQKQKALIARALLSDSRVLLLDEPTANVDKGSQDSIHEILAGINKTKTIVMVSHNIDYVTAFVDRVACVSGELVTHHTHDVHDASISRKYGMNIARVCHRKTCSACAGEEE